MNKVFTTPILVGLLLCVSIGLFFVRTDRQEITLPPDTEPTKVIPLATGTRYSQEFVLNANTIRAVGVYVRPLVQDLPPASVSLELRQGDMVLHSQKVPVDLLSVDAPIFLRIPHRTAVNRDQKLVLYITVPPELSNKVGLMQRTQTQEFSRDAILFVDENAQDNPAAYVVFSSSRPQISVHVLGLCILAAVFLLIRHHAISKVLLGYSILLPVIAALPVLFITQSWQLLLVCTGQAILIFFTIRYLRQRFVLPAALFGGQVLTFTTYWPFVLLGDGTWFNAKTLSSMEHLRDVFLDPNQLNVLPIGAYVGIPAIVLAVLGVCIVISRFIRTKSWDHLLFLISGLLGGLVVSPIITVITLTYLAAAGMDALVRFLGAKDTFVHVLIYALLIISFVELVTPYVIVLDYVS